jgi:hypothetical protein
VFRDEWLGVGLSTEPADRPAAEAAARLAYERAGLAPPSIVLWLDSPLAGAIGAAMLAAYGVEPAKAQVRDQVGDQVWAQVRDQVRAQVRDQVRAQVRDQVGAQVGDQVRDQVGAQVGDQVGDQVWAQVRDQVRAQVRDQVWAQVGDQVWAQVRDQVRAQVRDQVGAQVRDQVGAQVWRAGYGQHDASWLGFYATFDRFGLDVSKLDGLLALARFCGWWWPFAGAVILTERPRRLCRDTEGRLHSDDGRAIEYPDGWGIYAWHGTRVPEDVILRPSALEAATILGEENAEVRRVMIERAGLARIVEAEGAEILDADTVTVRTMRDGAEVEIEQERTLYRVPLEDDEPVVCVAVACPSTDGRYVLRVPPGVTSCAAAVAWTFGYERAGDYRPVLET